MFSSILEFFQHFFSEEFMPHGHCYYWEPAIVWLHVVSDAMIAISYFTIPVSLLYFIRKRTDLRQFRAVFVMFGAFILACGLTHVAEVWVVWHPMYRFTGVIKFLTAVISGMTAIILVPLIPKALALPSPNELQEANQKLRDEIAERNLAEARSHHAENKFRSLLEFAPDAMVIVNDQGYITLVNTQTERLFGFTRDELLNQPIDMLMPQRFHDRHKTHRHNFFANPGMRPMGRGLDLFGQTKDGTEFPIEISLSPLETEDGTVVMSAIRDITERKLVEQKLRDARDQLEERVEERNRELIDTNRHLKSEVEERKQAESALQKKTQELERSNQELEQFAYIASHDLKEPLRAVNGYLQVIERRFEEQLTPAIRGLIQRAVQAVLRMEDLINDLLSYSRVGRKERIYSRINTQEIVTETLHGFDDFISKNNGQIVVESLPDVYGVANQIRQVFQNLIGNAIKFSSPSEPQVRVGGRILEHEWEFFVQDNGIGIDPENVGRIFVLFQRLHSRDEYPGTGIGLAICKKIVDFHGGRIWVDSTPGHGSTFRFTLTKEPNNG